MDLNYPPEAEAFREEIRRWLRDALPEGWAEGQRPPRGAAAGFAAQWDRMLHLTGWACPTWPVAYGGRGLSVLEAIVLAEEMAAVEAPLQPPLGGELLVGPTVLHWGSDEQKRRFLPPIARGEEIWCQGFSEPDAGSDLGSLQTSAHIEGDDWVIDGHKIWTSQAEEADFAFVLARTSPDAPKHRGISYLLVPMRRPGVEVRPIAQPDGTAGFNEVIFHRARTPVDHVVGGIDNGWTVAMSTLGFERGTSATSSWQRFARDLNEVISVARATGLIHDGVLRQRLARAYTMIQIQRVNGYRVVTSVLHPEVATSTAALEAGTKALYTEFLQELTNLAMDVAGLAGTVLSGRDAPVPGVGMGDRPVLHEYPANAVQSAFLFARAGTIYGGTSQIQRNIIAERVLGLPREPLAK